MKVCNPSVTFTSTVMVIASTPYTALPNVFTNILHHLADEARKLIDPRKKNPHDVSRDRSTARDHVFTFSFLDCASRAKSARDCGCPWRKDRRWSSSRA